MRNCKIPKSKPRFIYKRQFKYFNEQAFLHDLFNSDLGIVSQMADVDLAWDCFNSIFLAVYDNTALFEDFG